jgi:nitrate reductase molybdenum cofactor assembly chaperone NarJ/NarW
MSRAESYQALAMLLEYPQDREAMILCSDGLQSYLEKRGLEPSASSFADYLRGSTLARLQEDYLARFDSDPTKTPYLGHHLHDDSKKKATFMIRVKHEFTRSCFSPSTRELPDHLSVLLFFLAHLARLGEDERRRQFTAEAVLPGLKKLVAAGEPCDPSPWLPVIKTAEKLLSADCEEIAAP